MEPQGQGGSAGRHRSPQQSSSLCSTRRCCRRREKKEGFARRTSFSLLAKVTQSTRAVSSDKLSSRSQGSSSPSLHAAHSFVPRLINHQCPRAVSYPHYKPALPFLREPTTTMIPNPHIPLAANRPGVAQCLWDVI